MTREYDNLQLKRMREALYKGEITSDEYINYMTLTGRYVTSGLG
ncbi:MAG: hypothetical protein ABIH52_03805 [Candidatus Aenigmatarchaeota archaeon]